MENIQILLALRLSYIIYYKKNFLCTITRRHTHSVYTTMQFEWNDMKNEKKKTQIQCGWLSNLKWNTDMKYFTVIISFKIHLALDCIGYCVCFFLFTSIASQRCDYCLFMFWKKKKSVAFILFKITFYYRLLCWLWLGSQIFRFAYISASERKTKTKKRGLKN